MVINGARSTRLDPKDEDSTVMHVAAPIMDNNNDGKPRQLLGVLTVCQTDLYHQAFHRAQSKKILQRSFWVLLISFADWGFFWWLSRSSNVCRIITQGRQVSTPKQKFCLNSVITKSANSGKLSSMRAKLEQEYVETLMHTFNPRTKARSRRSRLG